MDEQELTPWFPADVKPTREGIYIVQNMYDSDSSLWNYWNGKKWCGASEGFAGAMDYLGGMMAFQDRVWRGLAKEPQ